MSTPPEHAPTEPQQSLSPPPSTTPPVRSAGGGGYDPVARIALVIIAAIMVVFLLLTLLGYNFHVVVDKDKDKGDKGGNRNNGPKQTQSANP